MNNGNLPGGEPAAGRMPGDRPDFAFRKPESQIFVQRTYFRKQADKPR